jgi:phosphatidylglycerophosphatase A
MWGGAGGALLLSAACIPLGALAERVLGRKDPSEFVLDEVAGFLVAVAFLPFSWLAWGTSFVAFRIVDATKPPPLGRIQALRGGWGILADDLLAGLLANGIARVVILFA